MQTVSAAVKVRMALNQYSMWRGRMEGCIWLQVKEVHNMRRYQRLGRGEVLGFHSLKTCTQIPKVKTPTVLKTHRLCRKKEPNFTTDYPRSTSKQEVVPEALSKKEAKVLCLCNKTRWDWTFSQQEDQLCPITLENFQLASWSRMKRDQKCRRVLALPKINSHRYWVAVLSWETHMSFNTAEDL